MLNNLLRANLDIKNMPEASPKKPECEESSTSIDSGRIPTGEKLAYGAGAVPENLFNALLNQFGQNVFTMVFAMNPALVGTILAIPRLWDAIFDPIVGNFSDNLQSPWGRRKPLMLVGSILASFTFAAIFWMPEAWSDNLKFAYLLGGCIVFYSFATMYCIPFVATGYELTSDYNERSRLMGVRSFFAPVGIFLIPTVFAFAVSDSFETQLGGVRTISLCIAVLLIGVSLIPVLKVRTKIVPAASTTKPRIPFFKAVKLTLSNRCFLLTLVPCLLVAMSLNLTGGLYTILNIHYVFGGVMGEGAAFAAGFFVFGQVLGMISAPISAKLATVYGKKQVMCVLLFLMAVGSASTFFLMTPANPYLVLISFGILGPAQTGIFMLYHAMVADVCDYDELNTGARREATYGAVAGWIYKSGSSLAIFSAGLGLWLAGFDASFGSQSESTLFSLRLQYALIPATATVLGLLLFLKYPITEKFARDVQAKLNARIAR